MGVCGGGLPLAVFVALQKTDPICRVLVEMKLGVVLLKGRPALSEASALRYGVQVTAVRFTPEACVRYRVETASRAGLV